jgi:hypothetical protein
MSEPRNVTDKSELLAAIQEIKAVDNHSHAMPARRPTPDEADRPDPLGRTPFLYPVRLRVTNPEYVEAWRALYGYEHQDMTDAHVREALRVKMSLMEQERDHYPSWVLDRAGIDVMLVNTSGLGPGQAAPRFHWVPYIDELLVLPERYRATHDEVPNQDTAYEWPATLEGYIDGIIKPQLQRWWDAGILAVKSRIAYSRSLHVEDIPLAVAAPIYERATRRVEVSPRERRSVQGFSFPRYGARSGASRSCRPYPYRDWGEPVFQHCRL